MQRIAEQVQKLANTERIFEKKTHQRTTHDIPRNERIQAWCPAIAKASVHCQEFMRKIHKQVIFTSILDRFQNDEIFHANQLQHNWTKEWCEYLDYIRTIDITHNASPEQLKRYAALYHFRYDPKQMEKGPQKRRPDYHQTTRAIVSMNKEAGQTQEREYEIIIARIWTQRSSTGLCGSHTIGNGTSR